jgi:hypothetical protein
MVRISSQMTFAPKRVVPIVQVGLLLFMVAQSWSLVFTAYDWSGPLVLALLMTGMSFVVLPILRRRWTWSLELVDEVCLDGDFLILRRSGQEDRIPFSDIVNIVPGARGPPTPVTLKLRRPSLFGSEVMFCAPEAPRSSGLRTLIENLTVKAEVARRQP